MPSLLNNFYRWFHGDRIIGIVQLQLGFLRFALIILFIPVLIYHLIIDSIIFYIKTLNRGSSYVCLVIAIILFFIFSQNRIR